MVDNTKITVRPIFSELNQSYKVRPFQEWLSVDESMIPYYGSHGCKQFIKCKPIVLYHMEPYTGLRTLLSDTGLGQGPSVVIGLAAQAQVPQHCKFFHDNLFTTLLLFDEMTKRGYGSSGTVRQKAFMKLPRGTIEELCQGQQYCHSGKQHGRSGVWGWPFGLL